MSEYIKREDAERLLRYDFLSALTEDERVAELDRIPSADVVEVVHGEWEDTNLINGDIGWRCSVCGFGVMRWNANHYCPNCGARMDGERKDGDKE